MNKFIGLMLNDTPNLLTGILGTLKAGGTFVPLNPVFPEERLQFIIADCRIRILLTDDSNYDKALEIASASSSG